LPIVTWPDTNAGPFTHRSGSSRLLAPGLNSLDCMCQTRCPSSWWEGHDANLETAGGSRDCFRLVDGRQERRCLQCTSLPMWVLVPLSNRQPIKTRIIVSSYWVYEFHVQGTKLRHKGTFVFIHVDRICVEPRKQKHATYIQACGKDSTKTISHRIDLPVLDDFRIPIIF
jgi:hypothetical protein